MTRANSEQEQADVAKTDAEEGALSIVHRVVDGETAASIGALYGISDYASLSSIISAGEAAPNENFEICKPRSSLANSNEQTPSNRRSSQHQQQQQRRGGIVWLPILSFGVLQSLGDDFYVGR